MNQTVTVILVAKGQKNHVMAFSLISYIAVVVAIFLKVEYKIKNYNFNTSIYLHLAQIV